MNPPRRLEPPTPSSPIACDDRCRDVCARRNSQAVTDCAIVLTTAGDVMCVLQKPKKWLYDEVERLRGEVERLKGEIRALVGTFTTPEACCPRARRGVPSLNKKPKQCAARRFG